MAMHGISLAKDASYTRFLHSWVSDSIPGIMSRGFMKRLLQACVLSLITVPLSVGCAGINCPYNRPACCDNALFGCGPFDLPQGCSCSDYFSRSYSGTTLQNVVASRSTGSSPLAKRFVHDATWRISIQKQDDNCPYISDSIQSTIMIRTQGKRVEVKIPGYSKLRGLRSNRSMRVRGIHQLQFPSCIATIEASIIHESQTAGSASGKLGVVCQQSSLSCSTTFQGTGRKL